MVIDEVMSSGWRPTRWWRAVAPDGEVWCESSSELEVRERARPGDRVVRLFRQVRHEWRTTDDRQTEVRHDHDWLDDSRFADLASGFRRYLCACGEKKWEPIT